MIVLNEAQYIARNLEQHYPLADSITVVEGADRLYPATRVTSDGLSTDETASLVRDFPDPDKKIRFIQHGWTSTGGAQAKCELRNRYMENVTPGLLIAVDADEFYRRDELSAIIKQIRQDDSKWAWRFPSLHFWKTTDQFITGGYYDIEHIRFWRVRSGDRYRQNHNYPERGTHPLQDFGLRVHDRRLVSADDAWQIAGPVCLHFGFCKDPEHIRDKNDYYCNRGERATRPKTIVSREAWFQEELPDGLRLWRFGGTMPEVFH
jgi:hypothetical protein